MIRRISIVVFIILAIIFAPITIGGLFQHLYLYRLPQYYQATNPIFQWIVGLILLGAIVFLGMVVRLIYLYIVEGFMD